jgi:hypothetical protein
VLLWTVAPPNAAPAFGFSKPRAQARPARPGPHAAGIGVTECMALLRRGLKHGAAAAEDHAKSARRVGFELYPPTPTP